MRQFKPNRTNGPDAKPTRHWTRARLPQTQPRCGDSIKGPQGLLVTQSVWLYRTLGGKMKSAPRLRRSNHRAGQARGASSELVKGARQTDVRNSGAGVLCSLAAALGGRRPCRRGTASWSPNRPNRSDVPPPQPLDGSGSRWAATCNWTVVVRSTRAAGLCPHVLLCALAYWSIRPRTRRCFGRFLPFKWSLTAFRSRFTVRQSIV